MRIAQHFSAGIKSRFTNESVKRTAETESFTDFSGNRNLNLAFNRPLRGLNRLPNRTPAINRWAIFKSSAPADEMHVTFWASQIQPFGIFSMTSHVPMTIAGFAHEIKCSLS